MALNMSAVLYPVNSTTVDSGGAVDIRLLSSTEAGADDSTQSANFTHTQDNAGRIFNPATAAVTTNQFPSVTLANIGWALRLAEDMTPSDDTNCNAVLTAGTLTVNLRVNLTQAGGTYASGTYGPNMQAALWILNLSTNTGSLIAVGANSAATTWNIAGVGGDLGTAKNASLSIVVPSNVEFAAGEVLFMQVGFGTGTVPNPTLGTATFTCTLTVDNANTNITWASGQGIREVCSTTGDADGVGSAAGVDAIVLPSVGASAGIASAAGALQATANMQGDADGSSAGDGVLAAFKELLGASAGSSSVDGQLIAFKETVGDSDGSSSVDGLLQAVANMEGVSAGSSTADGALQATADMEGASAGSSAADGALVVVKETTGEADGEAIVDGVVGLIVPTVGSSSSGGGINVTHIFAALD